ncbi:MAG: tryptophan--tRNA ligase [Desulfobacteraceae bacterium]|nr:tryptophan--tRNA ligase [Desulfobacteraceae bacterium]MBC2755322.1 tryptophan--tRNA ligase [Desulfobacteraceae bacterium]
MTEKKRIVSGMRPTGALHLGNYHGALKNWISMQDSHDCFFFIADWHALTSNYEDTGDIPSFTRQMIIDWLSAGLAPEKSTLFVQSHIKEHAELFLLLSMITPTPWLERNPTYKDQIDQLNNKDLSTFGFLGYPVLQAADIIIYKAQGVPVGIDQAPHIEITREIARRFNYLYGNVFPEPETILTEMAKILGTDRRKMSKSYHNAIYLSDTPEAIMSTVLKMVTDPQRARKSDPGNPHVCNVYEFHRLYSPESMVSTIDKECRSARIGCVDCKKMMAKNLIDVLAPIRKKNLYFKDHPEIVDDILASGEKKAGQVARETLEEVREAVNL